MSPRVSRRRGALLKNIYKKLLDFYGPQGWWPGDSPFEVMVGAVLTQNTSWKNVEKAIGNLRSKNLLEPYRLHKTPTRRLASLLTPSGYFNVKTKRLKSLLKFFVNNFDGDFRRMKKRSLRSLRTEMLKVNGVGRETCDSILLYALDKPIFVVDAYTRRIFSRYGFISETESYDEIQNFFMKNLDDIDFRGSKNGGRITNHQSLVTIFNEFHALIVKHGKTLCKKNPLCDECPLLNLGCDFGNYKITRDWH